MAEWAVMQTDNDVNDHVVPEDDALGHIVDIHCACQPKWVAYWCFPHSSIHWTFRHNPWDGREIPAVTHHQVE